VYRRGQYVGDVQMAQLTVGWQLGGQAYSQLVCFKDQRAFEEFTSGSFEFGAQATAVALTAGATAETSSKGHGASISGGRNDARTEAAWRKGMAVFTITKGGLMYEAAIGGQKFNYQPKHHSK
jgi:lipid-binding SYLF domain-containing protein